MNKAGNYILFSGAAAACTSILYFFSLLPGLPFPVTVAAMLALLYLLYRWFPKAGADEGTRSLWAYAILALGLYLISSKAIALAAKHGEWDAWAIWNLHAAFLSDTHYWKNMLHNTAGHPDYPLCMPALLAFFRNLFAGHLPNTLSFTISIWFTLCIPVLIYTSLYRKNMVIAAAALLLIASDDFFIARGVSQYADTLLAFFFLAAFCCIDAAKTDKKYIALCTFMLGCCIWTKNEGIVLAGIFALFYAKTFLKRTHIIQALAGIALPMGAWLVFKLAYAPANDMVQGLGNDTGSLLFAGSRYHMIWDLFKVNLNKNFIYLKTGFYLYLLRCILQKEWPGRQMLLLLCCLLAYFMIYVITPRDLQWQLSTSQDRLMHQLMPAMAYVIARKLSDLQFLLPQKQTL